MKETVPGEFNPLSAEDREKMERLGREAEDILAAAETAPQEQVLEEGRDILAEESGKDVALVEEAVAEFFNNQELIEKLSSDFEEQYGWHKGKFRAMVGALRHGLDEVYYRSRPTAVDEHDPHPEGESRDMRNVLFSIIAEDYGAETAREALPLINYYVKEANALVKKERGISDKREN